jgi:hypothetical protein
LSRDIESLVVFGVRRDDAAENPKLVRDLQRAGSVNRGGKGSHRMFGHLAGANITLSGKLGADAKTYQERDVQQAIAEAERGDSGA